MAKLVEVTDKEYAAAFDPTEGMSTTQKFLAGTGKGMTDIYRGAKQLLGKMTPEEYDAIKQQDAPLMATTPGMLGNMAGQAAPALAIPTTGLLAAGGIGATQGLLAPVGTGDSREVNTAIGGIAGFGAQGIANLLGKALSGPAKDITAEKAKYAVRAKELDMPLRPGQITGNPNLQGIEAGFASLPLTARVEKKISRTIQDRMNTLAANAMGENADNVGAEVLSNSLEKAGLKIGDIAKSSTVRLDNAFVQKLIDAADEIALMPNALPGKAQAMRLINEYADKAINAGVMSGAEQQQVRSVLRQASETGMKNATTVPQARAQKSVQKALDDAMYRSIPTADQEVLKAARTQYAAAKAVGATSPVAGDVSGAGLSGIMNRQMPTKGTYQIGGSEPINKMRDAAEILRAFKVDIPDSGTPYRQSLQTLLRAPGIGLGGMIAGGAAGSQIGSGQPGDNNSMEGAMIGGLGALLAPRAIQGAYYNPLIQYYLTHGLMKLPDSVLRAGGAVGAPAALQFLNE